MFQAVHPCGWRRGGSMHRQREREKKHGEECFTDSQYYRFGEPWEAVFCGLNTKATCWGRVTPRAKHSTGLSYFTCAIIAGLVVDFLYWQVEEWLSRTRKPEKCSISPAPRCKTQQSGLRKDHRNAHYF